MAIPSTPTWTATISAAMISAGRLNVSFNEVNLMSQRGAQDIKTELWSSSRTDLLLQTETVVLVTTGSSVFTVPPDFDSEVTLNVYYGYDGLRSQAQAGNTQSITLAASDGAADDAYNGYYVFTLSGTNSGQYRQITAYRSATKVASLSSTWNAPDATTNYLVANLDRELTRAGDVLPVTIPGIPRQYRVTGPTVTVWPAPDKIYPIVMVYQPNLTMIDETSDIFLRWLKQRMSLVKQGIKVMTMALYDDDRYQQELQRWEQMKGAYGAQNPTYSQVLGHR
jgi:hypothetical protein